MTFLRWLEGLRSPILNVIMQGITQLGSEAVFLVVALAMFWCIDKRRGYYLLSVGFFGIAVNQFLKLLCRVPRPWVLDPDFSIVESARADAGGYSFPSGHTQNAVGAYGAIGLTSKRPWVRGLCLALCILIPFSRMYLGVHTPLDVGAAALTALALLLILRPVVFSENRKVFAGMLGLMLAVAVGFVVYVECAAFPGGPADENVAHGTKNAYSLLGALLGLIAAYTLDVRKLRFRVEAVWWAQLLKLTLGAALLLGIRVALKAPLNALFHGHGAASGLRYCAMVLFAGVLWPMTFPWFARLGKQKTVGG